MQTAIYDFKKIPSDRSLKNSCTFFHAGAEYIAATDMDHGGVVVIRPDGTDVAHYFYGWRMMWAPHVIEYQGKLWCFVCDTAGGDTSHWWDYMRVYRFEFDLASGYHGRVIRVEIDGDTRGIIDPCVVCIDGIWQIFYAGLLQPGPDNTWGTADDQWWDPRRGISETDTPFGPFVHSFHLGIGDPPFSGAVVSNITEAPKFFYWAGQPHLYTAHGNSGENGHARVSQVLVTGRHPDGFDLYQASPVFEIKSKKSTLCTALEGFPTVTATCRDADGFYLARMG